MSKFDVLGQGRNEGMVLALEIAQKAKDAGKDPLVALASEVRWRNRNGIRINVSRKEFQKEVDTFKLRVIKTMLATSMISLWEEFKFGKKRLVKFAETYMRYATALCNESIEWADITDLLKEKMDLTIDFSDDTCSYSLDVPIIIDDNK